MRLHELKDLAADARVGLGGILLREEVEALAGRIVVAIENTTEEPSMIQDHDPGDETAHVPDVEWLSPSSYVSRRDLGLGIGIVELLIGWLPARAGPVEDAVGAPPTNPQAAYDAFLSARVRWPDDVVFVPGWGAFTA